jgi:hypothetical protein
MSLRDLLELAWDFARGTVDQVVRDARALLVELVDEWFWGVPAL